MRFFILAALLFVALSQLGSGTGSGTGTGSMPQRQLTEEHITDPSFRCFLNCMGTVDMTPIRRAVVQCLFIDNSQNCFDTRVTPGWMTLKQCLVPCFNQQQQQTLVTGSGTGSAYGSGSPVIVAPGAGTGTGTAFVGSGTGTALGSGTLTGSSRSQSEQRTTSERRQSQEQTGGSL